MPSILSSRSRLPRAPLAACLMAALGLGGVEQALYANTIIVSDCTDGASSTTLRHAIAGAISGDSIDVSACVSSTITLAAEISISVSDLTIHGPANNSLTIDANHNSRVFDHTAGSSGTLTLQHLATINGQQTGTVNVYGGCIYSKGSVHLDHVTVSGCQALVTDNGGNAFGGGVAALQSIVLDHSTISGNEALASSASGYAYGGGLFSWNGLTARYSTITGNHSTNVATLPPSAGGGLFSRSVVVVQSTTIDSNTAGQGGAMYLQYGTLTITNSTISGNIADTKAAGGIQLPSIATTTKIYNTTVAFNSAAQTCAGICSYGGALTIQSTIVANNSLSAAGNADLYSTNAVSGGSSLIVSANHTPGGTLTTDPQLAPLANNGGLTRTHAIDATSPAFDAGSNAHLPPLEFDQRGCGFSRSVGTAPDIGAYELQIVGDELFCSGFE
jgi:hypothetical protein